MAVRTRRLDARSHEQLMEAVAAETSQWRAQRTSSDLIGCFVVVVIVVCCFVTVSFKDVILRI